MTCVSIDNSRVEVTPRSRGNSIPCRRRSGWAFLNLLVPRLLALQHGEEGAADAAVGAGAASRRPLLGKQASQRLAGTATGHLARINPEGAEEAGIGKENPALPVHDHGSIGDRLQQAAEIGVDTVGPDRAALTRRHC